MTKVHDDFGTSILGGFGWRRKKTLKIRMTLNDRVFISLPYSEFLFGILHSEGEGRSLLFKLS